MNTLPEIKKSELSDLKDTWDYLFVIIEKYFSMIEKDNNVMSKFRGEQHTLMAYNYLVGEVNNGGFIQLINNGYGPYIFESPLSETLREWGLVKTADIIDKAEKFYQKHKDEIAKEMSMEDFSKLYEKINDFKSLEDMFFETDESDIMKEYIEKHMDEFFILK